MSMIKALGFRDYKEYLTSTLWHSRRDALLKLRPFCATENCNKKAVDVHHLTYDNIGNEGQRDLMQLCRECHKKIHGVKDE